MRFRAAFTLIEMLVGLAVIVILTAVLLPRFSEASSRAKQSARKTDLRLMRLAIERFKADTGAYPASLSDLWSKTAPMSGRDANGGVALIAAHSWKGPYLDRPVERDPLSSKPYKYRTTAPDVGSVSVDNTATVTPEPIELPPQVRA